VTAERADRRAIADQGQVIDPDRSKDYRGLLDRIHAYLEPATYVEIGVGAGRSLAAALPKTEAVAIDPKPRRYAEEVRCPVRLFRLTADEFFEQHDLRELLDGRAFDLAFIDGMHLFEFALRDFVNLERHSDERSVVLLHDCLPLDAETSSREQKTTLWTGDVWKLVVCLREYRPELRVSTIEVAPSGLGLVTGLDRSSRVLAERYDEICARFVAMGFDAISGSVTEALRPLPNDWSSIRGLLPTRGGGRGQDEIASGSA
jgi:hypothetical protein